MIVGKHSTSDLLRWAALGACRVMWRGNELRFERPGYERPEPAPLTDAEHVVLAELDRQLLAMRPPWPEPTPAERWAAFVADQHERTAYWTPAMRDAAQRDRRRRLARYGLRRLRAGHEWRWQRPLAVVRAETVAALRELGHVRLAGWVQRPLPPARSARATRAVVQMELGL